MADLDYLILMASIQYLVKYLRSKIALLKKLVRWTAAKDIATENSH